jgi:hypothetical protein
VIGQCVAVPVALQPGVNNGGPDNNYCGPGFIYQSGSAHLRQAAATRTNLANGNFNAVVTSLVANASAASVANGTALSAGAGSVTSYNTTWQGFVGGTLVRNGCDRLAFGGARAAINGGVTTGNTNGAIGGNPNSVVCYPEDYIRMNNSMDQAAYNDNWGFTNYHQVQMQYTLRTSNGMSIQATYLTSKTLALPRDFYRTSTFGYNATGGGFFGDTASRPPITGFSDPQSEESRRLDYGLSSDSLKHSVRVNAVMQLPFGPGQPLFSKASGILARIVGGWNLSVIYNAQSGAPFSIYAGDMLYGDQSGTATGGCNAYSGTSFASFFGSGANCQSGLSFPDVVSPLWSNPRGKLEINGPDGSTTFFGNPAPFALIPDPQCTNGASVGRNPISDIGGVYNTGTSACSLQALVMKVPEGTPGAFVSTSVDNGGTPLLIMLQNPLPGNRGSLGAQTMRQPSRFYLDASLSKNIMFTERRGIQLRLDATNVLNHPQPVDVYMSIGPGGQIVDRSDANSRALANGCFNQYQSNSTFNNTANSSLVNGLANCGRQVQVSFRMINN